MHDSLAPLYPQHFSTLLKRADAALELGASSLIEVGIQEQWHDHAASPGQVWAGYRIVAISDTDAERLHSWLDKN